MRKLIFATIILLITATMLWHSAGAEITSITPSASFVNSLSPQSPSYGENISDAQYDQLRLAILKNTGHISQKWGEYSSRNKTSGCTTGPNAFLHPGVDIAEVPDRADNTPVYTPVGGLVTRVEPGSDVPNRLSTVAIYNSQADKTYIFLHMDSFDVSENSTIPAGTKLGTIGKRGADAYHVHFEVRSGRQIAAATCITGTIDPYYSTSFSVPSPPPPPVSDGQTKTWDFGTAGNYQGWTVIHASASAVHDGALFIDPSGDDPYIESPPLNRNVLLSNPSALLYPFIKVRMASNGLDGTGAIYFKTSLENYYSENKKVVFNVANCPLCGNAATFEYTIPMAGFFGGNDKWTGTITGIRLDPTGHGQGGTNLDSIGIDYIRLWGWGDLGGGGDDEMPPTLIISSPSDGQVVTNNTLVVSGTASDAGRGDNGVAIVTVNGAVANNSVAQGAGTAFWNKTISLAPGSNSITVTAADSTDMRYSTTQTITVFYQQAPTTYNITGRLIDNIYGTGVNDILVTVSGSQNISTTTSSNGNFSFYGLPVGGNYTITPFNQNYDFSPPSYTINNLQSNNDINLIAIRKSYGLNGRVTTTGGTGLGGASLYLSCGCGVHDQYWNVTTDQNGNYSFSGLPAGGNFNLSVSRLGFRFTPPNRTFDNVQANQIADFVASPAVSSRYFDFDGDGKADIATWRRNSGDWNILNSSNGSYTSRQWGSAVNYADAMVPGDYDGDGKADVAVWRPGTGYWYILNSSSNTMTAQPWGNFDFRDMPVPADYDGDGKTDIAVWRALTGIWYIQRSSDGALSTQQFGLAAGGDVAVPGDYDGDGRADIAIWRHPSTWYILKSSDQTLLSRQWGSGDDVIVPRSDFDGDGIDDLAVWRSSTAIWYILRSSDGGVTAQQWGGAYMGDTPVAADYDGDGRTDLAVWRMPTGVWYILKSSNGQMQAQTWGHQDLTDLAVPSAYVRYQL